MIIQIEISPGFTMIIQIEIWKSLLEYDFGKRGASVDYKFVFDARKESDARGLL
jgi:hypothetical protein